MSRRSGSLALAAAAALAGVVCVAAPARAQDAAPPAKPVANGASTAEEPSLIDRWRTRYDRITASGIYPKAGTIVSGSSLAFGVELRRPRFGESPIGAQAEAMWSIRGYQEYGLQIGLVEQARHTLELGPAIANVTSMFNDRRRKEPGRALSLDLRYLRHPQVDFFGIGPGAPSVRADFAVSGISADALGQWQPTARVGVSARGGLLDLDTGPGTDDAQPNIEAAFTPLHAPGLERRARFFTAGVGAAIDTRDVIAVPTMGAFVGASVRQFTALNDEAGSFTRLAVDARLYRPLLSAKHVLAVSLLAAADRTADESPTPFYLQPWMGGSRTLRGAPSYRFRAETILHGSAEYRWRVVKYIEVAPFLDIGAYGRRLSDLSGDTLEVTPGIGLRVRSDDKFFVRMDWAKGADGHRLIFSLHPPF